MSDPVIRLTNVGKMYKVFSNRRDNLLDAVGLTFLAGRQRQRYKEFWALRGVDLTLGSGRRIGIIGRNGAGKSTLLKLITGNLPVTEGAVEVKGSVQALIDAGAGFHPEFTGYENVRAALSYQGFSRGALRDAIEDIAEFTELGDFLAQPLKTYSSGMQARLAFATATAVKPEILVIDEVMGAGDAYFIAKSVERIQQITDSGASMIIVSHSMAQITQFCEEAIWLDRGRIVLQGTSVDVVKAYDKYMRELDDRRIQDRNRKRRHGASVDELERPEISLHLRLVAVGPSGSALDVRQIRLLRDGVASDVIEVGAPQDADATHGAFVILENGSWSSPHEIGGKYARSLSPNGVPAAGSLIFNLFHVHVDARYEMEVEYRRAPEVDVTVEAWRGNSVSQVGELRGDAGLWQRTRLRVPLGENELPGRTPRRADLSYWPAEGSLHITDVGLANAAGQHCAVFEPGDQLRLEIVFEPVRTDTYELLPAVVIYRLDGINISTQLGEWRTLNLEAGHRYRVTAILEGLNLGNGTYLASAALYKNFDPYLVTPPTVFDWIDRSIEFRVVGTPPAINSVFQHPSGWILDEI